MKLSTDHCLSKLDVDEGCIKTNKRKNWNRVTFISWAILKNGCDIVLLKEEKPKEFSSTIEIYINNDQPFDYF